MPLVELSVVLVLLLVGLGAALVGGARLGPVGAVVGLVCGVAALPVIALLLSSACAFFWGPSCFAEGVPAASPPPTEVAVASSA